MRKIIIRILGIAIIVFLGSCSSKHTCNKILNAAKKGNLFTGFDNTGFVRMDYFDCFTDNPLEYTSDNRSEIFVLQYFDSYELLESTEIMTDTLHRSFDMKKYKDGKYSELSDFEFWKSIAQESDSNYFIVDSVIYFKDGLVKTQSLKYLIKKRSDQYLQFFFCVKKENYPWKIYDAGFAPI